MAVMSRLPITHLNSIKLQASVMAQLTAATNQLTQQSQSLASTKCDELAFELKTVAKKVSFEDVKMIAADLAQCAANLRTVSEETHKIESVGRRSIRIFRQRIECRRNEDSFSIEMNR